MDLDIDSVTLCSYNISKNGTISIWSPYANSTSLEKLDASLSLPLPNGKKIQINEKASAVETNAFIDKYRSLFRIIKPEKGLLRLIINAKDPESIKLLGELLLEPYIPKFKNSKKVFNKFKSIYDNLTLEDIPLIYLKLLKAIDAHNLFLDTKSHSLVFEMMNNYILHQLLLIIRDPVNLLLAHKSVDEVTEPVLNIANKQGLINENNSRRGTGNSLGKLESANDNLEGKDCIAKSASSLKAFFAALHYYNITLNDGLQEEINNLLREDPNIRPLEASRLEERSFNRLLANIKVTNIANVTNELVLDAILAIKTDLNAVDFLSALLGLSADNAKELILSKINAGVDMIGMYLYGIATGEDFHNISRAMLSSTGNTIRQVLKGNIFTGEKAYGRASSVFSYFTLDGLKKVLGSGDWGIRMFRDLNKILTGTEISKKITETLTNKKNELQSKKLISSYDSIEIKRLDRALKIINSLKGVTPSAEGLFGLLNIKEVNIIPIFDSLILSLRGEKIEYLRYLRDIFNYIINYKNTENATLKYLKYLAYGADEMSKLGSFIMNKEIPSTLDEVLKKVNDFEYLIIDTESAKNKRLEKHNEESKASIISLEEVILNDEKLDAAIKELNGYKHTINILAVIKKDEHIRAYLKTLLSLDKFYKTRSYKYRSLRSMMPLISRKLYIKPDYLSKRLSSYIQSSMIADWLINTGDSFVLPKGNYYIDSGTKLLSTTPTSADLTIQLGADWANQTFRVFIELQIIPDLQNGILGRDIKGEPIQVNIITGNKFISDLSRRTRNNTIIGNITPVYTLPINMMPSKNSMEDRMLERYRDSFALLSSYSYTYYANGKQISIPLQDVFIYYTMFAFDWQRSLNSLLLIVNKELLLGKFSGFFEFEDALDKSDLVIEYDSITESNLTPYLALRGNPYVSGPKYIIYNDRGGDNKLLRKMTRLEEEMEIPHIGYYVDVSGTEDPSYYSAGKEMIRNKVIKEKIEANGNSYLVEIYFGADEIIKIDGKEKNIKDLFKDGKLPYKALVVNGELPLVRIVDKDLILNTIRSKYFKLNNC